MTSSLACLSLIVFLPALGALVIALFPRGQDDAMKLAALAFSVAVLAVTVAVGCLGGSADWQFQQGVGTLQNTFRVPWIESFQIEYALGLDGISFPLVALTAFLSVLALGASWSITKHVKGYLVLFLLLETGMLGVFMALDFFLFYVFWEVLLLPMYFLIGIWGGPRREYAAIKFFLYTLVGSVGMLVALAMLYFNSDVTKLVDGLSAKELAGTGLLDPYAPDGVRPNSPTDIAAAADALLLAIERGDRSPHTFNIAALQQIGQHTDAFDAALPFGWDVAPLNWPISRWVFLLLLVGFLIKIPSVPVHTWLPDAHVEAPTPVSMILAGVLLKMGGYGIIRFCYPICPEAGNYFALLVCSIGVLSMIYGAFAALAQTDFKRLVAYSSVSHMGYVVLGLGVWSATSGDIASADYWKMGASGAMFQMIGHGISSAGMFFMVGVVYERVHHRNLNEFGGLFAKMPYYCAMSWILFLAAVGLPGLCGFWGEAFVVLATWSYSKTLAIIAAFTVILTAGYILWAVQRVYLGAEYRGPHAEALTPMNLREWAIAVPLVVMAVVFGVLPKQTLFDYVTPTMDRTIDDVIVGAENYHERQEDRAVRAADSRRPVELDQKTPETNAVSARGDSGSPAGPAIAATVQDRPVAAPLDFSEEPSR